MRQDLIERRLAQGAPAQATADAVGIATAQSFRLLLSELEPLVGVQATRALYARSLHLTRPSFDWLSIAAAQPQDELLILLRRDLASRLPADARKAGEALLLGFADLLISLIGEPLTHRLLRSAWEPPAAADQLFPENTQ